MEGTKKGRSPDRDMVLLLICLIFIAPYLLLVVMPGSKSFIIMAALIACTIGYELHRLAGQPCSIPNPMNMPGSGDFYPLFIALFSAGVAATTILLLLRRINANIILRRCIAFFGIAAVVAFAAPADYFVSGPSIDLEGANSVPSMPSLTSRMGDLTKFHS